MMVVRLAPDAARAERQHAEDPHQPLGDFGVGQDRVVLLVVVDHEHADHQQAAHDTAKEFCRRMHIPDGARKSGNE